MNRMNRYAIPAGCSLLCGVCMLLFFSLIFFLFSFMMGATSLLCLWLLFPAISFFLCVGNRKEMLIHFIGGLCLILCPPILYVLFDQGGLKKLYICITHAGLCIAWLVSCMPMLMADFETKTWNCHEKILMAASYICMIMMVLYEIFMLYR